MFLLFLCEEEGTEIISTEPCTFYFLPVVFYVAPGLPVYRRCSSWLLQKFDGCDYTGCIFSSLKHLFVIVLNLLNHVVCRFELRAPHFYPLSMPCNFWRNALSTQSWKQFNSELNKIKTCLFLHCPTASLLWVCFRQRKWKICC